MKKVCNSEAREPLFVVIQTSESVEGHRPVIVKRAVIGSKGGWKLSTIF